MEKLKQGVWIWNNCQWFVVRRNFMYDRNEIKEIIDEIVFLKKYTLFDKQEYDEKL